MSYSHLIYMIEYNRDNEFLVFLGFILSIYLFHHFLKVRKITKEQDDILHQGVELVEETDVLGMKKIVYENTSNYTTLDKLMSWKVFVLMSLIFISVYVIVYFCGLILSKLIRIVFLGWIDRLGGAVVGILGGTILASALTFIFVKYPIHNSTDLKLFVRSVIP